MINEAIELQAYFIVAVGAAGTVWVIWKWMLAIFNK